MSQWESKYFQDVLTITNGRNQKKIENPKGKYPIYGSGGVMGYADDYICVANTVVIGRKGNINKPIFVEEPFWNVDTAFGLVANQEILLPKYLYYFCLKFDFLRLNTTVTIPSLTKSNLLKINIPLPPIEIQQKVAKKLDTAYDLLKLRKQQLAELDKLIQSVFYEIFGDPASNPMGWKTGAIRDVVTEVKYGTSKPAVEDGKYIYLRMNNITYDGYLDLTSLKYIDMPDSEVEKYIVRRGDILFNRTNSKELVGKTCVFDQNKEMIIAGYIIRLRTNERVVPEYLSAVLNSQYGKITLFGMCKAIIGQANINAQELQKINICIPPIELQKDYVKFVRQVDKLKFDIQKSLNEMNTLFNALLQKYFE